MLKCPVSTLVSTGYDVSILAPKIRDMDNPNRDISCDITPDHTGTTGKHNKFNEDTRAFCRGSPQSSTTRPAAPRRTLSGRSTLKCWKSERYFRRWPNLPESTSPSRRHQPLRKIFSLALYYQVLYLAIATEYRESKKNRERNETKQNKNVCCLLVQSVLHSSTGMMCPADGQQKDDK